MSGKMDLETAIEFMDDKIYWGTKGYETEARTEAWEMIKDALQKLRNANKSTNSDYAKSLCDKCPAGVHCGGCRVFSSQCPKCCDGM